MHGARRDLDNMGEARQPPEFPAGYKRLLEFLDYATSERFLKPVRRWIILVAADARTLLNDFDTYRAPNVPKWIRAERI
jgi:predicted Rossmann-fold nucleotide-binding protein